LMPTVWAIVNSIKVHLYVELVENKELT